MYILGFLLQEGGGAGSFIFSFLPFIFIIAIFYFLVIRPQQRRQQEAQRMISELKIGDNVITNSGIVGKIIEVRDKSFIIRSADKSNLEVSRASVAGHFGKENGN